MTHKITEYAWLLPGFFVFVLNRQKVTLQVWIAGMVCRYTESLFD